MEVRKRKDTVTLAKTFCIHKDKLSDTGQKVVNHGIRCLLLVEARRIRYLSMRYVGWILKRTNHNKIKPNVLNS